MHPKRLKHTEYFIGTLITTTVQLLALWAVMGIDLGRFIPGRLVVAGMVVFHIVLCLLVGRRMYHLNLLGLSAFTSIASVVVMLVYADVFAPDPFIGVIVIPLLWYGGVNLIPMLLIQLLTPRVPDSCCDVSANSRAGAQRMSLSAHCKEIARTPDGWQSLLQCPKCGCYWEVNAADSGVPHPVATRMDKEQAAAKYGV